MQNLHLQLFLDSWITGEGRYC